MAEKAKTTERLLDAIDKAGEDDLAEIQAELAELEKRRDTLREVERMLGIKLGKIEVKKFGPRKRQAAASAGGASDSGSALARGDLTMQRRQMAARCLVRVGNNGMAASALANVCNIPQGSISATFDHEWFEKAPDGLWRLSGVGKNKFM